MEIRLHLLDSFTAEGSDGKSYKVCVYERLMLVPGNAEQWEPTGEAEYRLDDGTQVEAHKDDTLRIAASGVVLKQPETLRTGRG